MGRILKFKPGYFILTVILFLIEVLIALFVNDNFVRPYVGDFLVVILIYCFLRSFINLSVPKLAWSALMISYIVETLQYFDIVGKLGLQNSQLAKTVLGSSFEWADIQAYSLGIILVVYVEKAIANNYRKDI